MQYKGGVVVRILVDVVYSIGIKAGGSPLNAVYFVTLLEQELREVGAVLSSDAGDKCGFLCHGKC